MHRDLRGVARAADAREARLLRTSCAVTRAAHQPDVLRRSGACQLCSAALLGEELCFRHTTILGSCHDLTWRSRRPSPAAHTASLVLLTVALYYLVPLAATEEAWASARIDKRAFRPCLPGMMLF
jgi:hypothetical protein